MSVFIKNKKKTSIFWSAMVAMSQRMYVIPKRVFGYNWKLTPLKRSTKQFGSSNWIHWFEILRVKVKSLAVWVHFICCLHGYSVTFLQLHKNCLGSRLPFFSSLSQEIRWTSRTQHLSESSVFYHRTHTASLHPTISLLLSPDVRLGSLRYAQWSSIDRLNFHICFEYVITVINIDGTYTKLVLAMFRLKILSQMEK